jgi:hypothetical protein
MDQMMLPPNLQYTVVAGLIRERQAEASEVRLAATIQRPPFAALRRRVGRGFVLAGAAIAREGLVDGSGEPLAVRAAQPTIAREPCGETEILRPAA